MKFENVCCNVCGSRETKFLGKRRGPRQNPDLETTVVQCSNCGLIYPDPMPSMTLGEIQGNYNTPDGYFADTPENRLGIFRAVLDAVEKYKPGKGKMLDVGCARGELLSIAVQRGWDVVGTDISDTFVAYAKKKYNVDARVGDLCSIDLKENTFDAVILVSVIQYLQDPSENIKKISRLLKKGGLLYIEVTNSGGLIFKMGDIMKSAQEGRQVTTHLSPLSPSFQLFGFTKRSLKKILQDNGFTIASLEVKGMRGGEAW